VDQIPYCIPCRRELTSEERDLVRFILEREAPQRLYELETLKVVARCGCGQCPTILFGTSPDTEPNTAHPFDEVATYYGRNHDGALVVVVLIDRDGRLSELEAYSPEGVEIRSWPSIASLTNNTNDL
jgi:hypothetical protein